MNILILTADNNRHKYFASKIIDKLDNDNVSVLIEPKKNPKNISNYRLIRIFKRLMRSKKKAFFLKRNFLNLLFYKYIKKIEKEKKNTEQFYFKNLSNSELHKLQTKIFDFVEQGKSINDKKYVNTIKNLNPDIIVVMGTSLIKEEIIKIPQLGILNMHTGLSPYYRGGKTNFWPFIFNDLGACGVTIHKLDIGIDSGDIISHGLPEITQEDTYSSINCKSIILGTSLMIEVIRQLIKEGNLKSVKQWKDSNCKLFYNDHFNGYHAFNYIKNHKKIVSNFIQNKKFPKGLLLNNNDN